MPHKPECPKSKDANAACTLNCEAPATRKCWDCDAEIGANEEKCPKCQTDLKTADEEDTVVGRSLNRMKKKNAAAKKKAAPAPAAEPPAKKKSPILGLGRMLK